MIYGIRAAAVFMISVSTIGLRTGALPRWLTFAGYVIAIVLLISVSFYELVVLVFPLWVIAVSLVILFNTRGRDPASLDCRHEHVSARTGG